MRSPVSCQSRDTNNLIRTMYPKMMERFAISQSLPPTQAEKSHGRKGSKVRARSN